MCLSSQAMGQTNDSSSPFETLPADLIHRVLLYLDPADIPPARLVCSYLAAIGIEYGYQDFSICFKRKRFQRLVNIASHPQISKRARSLHYHARQFIQLRVFKCWQSPTKCISLRD